ncbi:putative nucleotide-binding alpha-beta plait domain superfamily, RNA-binding domain superfamily [Helianthus anomalus]
MLVMSSFAKKKLSGGSVTKLSVSSVPKTVTKEDIRHAFEEHGQVEVALVKNKRTWQQQDIMGRTTTNIGKGRGRGVDRSSGEQGHSQGSVLGSSDIVGLKSNQQHTLMG